MIKQTKQNQVKGEERESITNFD